jgi:hypothetical protein
MSHGKPHLNIYTKEYHVGAKKILGTLEKQIPHQHRSYLQENVFMFKSPIANIRHRVISFLETLNKIKGCVRLCNVLS